MHVRQGVWLGPWQSWEGREAGLPGREVDAVSEFHRLLPVPFRLKETVYTVKPPNRITLRKMVTRQAYNLYPSLVVT